MRILLILIFFIPIRLFAYPTELKQCDLKDVEGKALCSTFSVLENRQLKESRKIELNIALLPAKNQQSVLEPLFILQGGPGQAATRLADFYSETFAKVREQRDIVMVDQRGTGKSNGLQCNLIDSSKGVAGYFGELFPIEKIGQCKEELEKRADLRMYTTEQAILDLEEVRRWLGHKKINLYGTSYGSIVGLQYLRMFPGSLRAVVLKGVVPPTARISITTARDAENSMKATIEDCAKQKDCSQAFPELQKEYETVINRISQGPARVKMTDPATEVLLSHENLLWTLRSLLHAPTPSAQLPWMIHRAYVGDYTPLAKTTLMTRKGLNEEISLGMFFTIYCSEDIPYVKPESVSRETAGTFHGDLWFRGIAKACQVWPRGKIPANYHEPVRSDLPVLLISGGLDPVTPPRLAQEAALTLPNGLQITVHEAGHSFNLMKGCVENIISDFIQSGSVKNLDASCTRSIRRPPFVTESK